MNYSECVGLKSSTLASKKLTVQTCELHLISISLHYVLSLIGVHYVIHNINAGRCWKKQLNIAKDARRVDVLCYRIFLSYRLLDGSSRFKELHEIVRDAKAKLETEVGPVNGVSAKMARGIVSRLPVAGEVLKLCSLAIDKADEWLAAVSNKNPTCRGNSVCVHLSL